LEFFCKLSCDEIDENNLRILPASENVLSMSLCDEAHA
jgi:hypothetical protein